MGKRTLILGIIGIIALFGALGVFLYLKGNKANTPISTAGVIEATEVNIGSKVSGRIKEIRFDEGDRVEKGEILIVLESEEIEAQLHQAEANLQAAKAEQENIEAGISLAKANISNVEAEIEKTRVIVDDAKRTVERYRDLLEKGILSQSEYDSAKTRYDTALAQLKSTAALHESARAGYNSALAQLKSAEARIRQATAAVTLYESQLKDTIIRSPITGTVILRTFEPGEIVASGVIILTIDDLDNLWARIDLEETKIGRISLDARAIVKANAISERSFTGRVIEIGEEAEFATQRDVTRGRQDIKTFRVKVSVPEGKGVLKPGMTVTVRFEEK